MTPRARRAAEIGDFPPGFAFFDDRQDLLVRELAPSHRVLLLSAEEFILRVAIGGVQVTTTSWMWTGSTFPQSAVPTSVGTICRRSATG